MKIIQLPISKYNLSYLNLDLLKEDLLKIYNEFTIKVSLENCFLWPYNRYSQIMVIFQNSWNYDFLKYVVNSLKNMKDTGQETIDIIISDITDEELTMFMLKYL